MTSPAFWYRKIAAASNRNESSLVFCIISFFESHIMRKTLKAKEMKIIAKDFVSPCEWSFLTTRPRSMWQISLILLLIKCGWINKTWSLLNFFQAFLNIICTTQCFPFWLHIDQLYLYIPALRDAAASSSKKLNFYPLSTIITQHRKRQAKNHSKTLCANFFGRRKRENQNLSKNEK